MEMCHVATATTYYYKSGWSSSLLLYYTTSPHHDLMGFQVGFDLDLGEVWDHATQNPKLIKCGSWQHNARIEHVRSLKPPTNKPRFFHGFGQLNRGQVPVAFGTWIKFFFKRMYLSIYLHQHYAMSGENQWSGKFLGILTGWDLRASLHYAGEVHRSWKKGRSLIVIGWKCNSWPVGVYTRWRNNGGELFSWMIKWHGRLRGGTFWNWASPASRGPTRNSSSGEAQLNKKYFLAFNSSLAHPPFASYNHVLAKHSWSSGGLLQRSVNRPLVFASPTGDMLTSLRIFRHEIGVHSKNSS